jgi:hypothetical protein
VSKSKPSAAYLRSLKQRYRQASRTERSAILDEFVQTSSYHRKYAIAILRGRQQPHRGPIRRPRARYYQAEDRAAVLQIAEWFDEISSRRLRAAMDATLTDLRDRQHLRVSDACFARLQVMSVSTLERIRAHVRPKRGAGHGRALTKPGTLLKRQIPIRTFADWDETRPGFVEIDLVAHCGEDASGDFAQTLDVTDILTGWTELQAVQNKAQIHVFAALQTIRAQLPVPLLGIDSDNGAEFINQELLRYCDQEHLTFTRGRVGRKNDNPFVEQKNWSVVRRIAGYERYDTMLQVRLLNQVYAIYRLYINFFLPVMKQKEKVRDGSRVRKIFDAPQTPYARLLASPDVTEADKARLRKIYTTLDVVQLKQHLEERVTALERSRKKR